MTFDRRPSAEQIRRARAAQIRSNIVVDDFGCWMWQGKTFRGYGWSGGVGAHRIAYETFVGPLPTNAALVIDHTCHNPDTCVNGDSCPHRRCVNPGHMELVTPYENWRRGALGKKYERSHGISA